MLSSLPLFVYGTLFDPVFAGQLLEHEVEQESATLLDHELVDPAVVPYPMVVPAPGGAVIGALLRGLGDEDFRRLDAYEGVGEGLYERRRALAVANATGGEGETVFVYVASRKTLLRYTR
jgi:gamma-glutamylcyclotransferase (GGCT)/AIG2-like uncharacterized protein YtfP